ncbi:MULTISPECIES: hypothetical protein [Rhizobium/Agrobacterium group]|uniref:hypothetical protein n=1 Tax=Rhizobium/Agrobacterium group TaxID=227290 RepID=UPI00059F80DB|nr:MULTISPECIES: hypothetical protein [Rhizobium/Agrobacterium group]MUO30818.1 hypothetical protein [Agrobacterium vitis]
MAKIHPDEALAARRRADVRRVYRMIALGEDKLDILREFYDLLPDADMLLPEAELRIAEAYAKEAPPHG